MALARRTDFAGMNAEIVRELDDFQIEVWFRFSQELWIWKRAPGDRGAQAFYEEQYKVK